jgi:sRNA-binding regulator protein Hfq
VKAETKSRRQFWGEHDRRRKPRYKSKIILRIHPWLKGKNAIIRLISGGQPVTGTVEGYNPHEILLQTSKGHILVFKYAIATIEITNEPKGFTIGR